MRGATLDVEGVVADTLAQGRQQQQQQQQAEEEAGEKEKKKEKAEEKKDVLRHTAAAELAGR